MILYRGPSVINGDPIVVVATGYGTRKSKNSKTGSMIQVWVLSEDLNPISAVMTGKDESICGSCKHRGPLGNRTCYVNIGKAPLNVWKTYKKGGYSECQDLRAFGAGNVIRIGAYGDPGAVPAGVWSNLLANSAGWTGYTHLWQSRPDLKSVCMASVDSLREQSTAVKNGWRTFRTTDRMLMRPTEFFCPASEEMGHKTTCVKCQLCNGTNSATSKSVVIMLHGAGV